MSRGLVTLTDQIDAWRSRGARPPGGSLPWYANPMTVRKVDENSTALTATNSTDETVIASVAMPAMVLASTGAARFTATGTIRQNTAGSLVLRVKAQDGVGQTTFLESSGISVAQSTSPHPWTLEAGLLGKQPNVNRGWGVLDIGGAGPSASLAPSTYTAVGFSTMGLNEMQQIVITVTAQWSAASPDLAATREVAILEAIN